MLANLYPLYGVVVQGWDVFPLMFLFWSENLAIGIFNLLRMAMVPTHSASLWLQKLFALLFFAVHFGGFTAIHGLFVIAVFGGDVQTETDINWPTPEILSRIIQDCRLILPISFFFLSHGFSFFHNYLGKGEHLRSGLISLLFRPYARITVMHVTILLGGFFMQERGSPAGGLAVLIVLKLVVDVAAHLREHRC
jgi:hypothetical protein